MMRVCYWGTYDRDSVRNRVLIAGLRQAGAQVRECHATVWRERQQRVAETARHGLSLRLLLRFGWAYAHLSARLLFMPRPDVVVVGYPGYTDVLVARPICWLRRVPLVLDAFLSIYETAVVDRALVSPGSLKARLLWHVERLACSLADLVLLDTEADCAFFRTTYGRGRYARLWVGAEEPPQVENIGQRQGEGLDVLFVGTFIPLHGVEHILRAAAILQPIAPEVRITLIGSGQTYTAMQQLAKELALTNVIWGPAWLDAPQLAQRCTSADVLLGIFGASNKAQRVIPLKAFAALAYGRPLLTADTSGIREALQPGETAFLCPSGDPAALAVAILAIRDAPAQAAQVAAQGHALYRQQFTPSAIGAFAIQLFTPLTERRNSR